ncbi:MAG: collagen-like triple helix repeat-containing protein [Acidimicrobiales bacterium]
MRARGSKILAASLLSLSGAVVGLASSAGAAVTATTMTSCTFSALKTAVLVGGTVDYANNCTVNFAANITVPSTDNVTVSANGHTVAFNGQGDHRLFIVQGTMALDSITMENAVVYAGNGAAGASGMGGASGTNGSPGNNGSSPGASGTAGQNGTAGDAGTAGNPGKAGASAKGGAFIVDTGARLTLDGDTINSSGLYAGNGGQGDPGDREVRAEAVAPVVRVQRALQTAPAERERSAATARLVVPAPSEAKAVRAATPKAGPSTAPVP